MKPFSIKTMTCGIILSALLCACSKQVDSAPSNNSQDTYYNIRKSLAAYNIESAAQLTTDPQKAFAQWKAYSDRVGKDVFMQKMQNTVDQIKFHSIRDQDEYSMILIDLPDNPYSSVAAQFYIKTDTGQYLELVDSTSDISCPLLRHFYDAKGEKDAKFSCRKSGD